MMTEQTGTTAHQGDRACVPPSAQRRYEVTRAQLPAHCPMDEMCLWNAHPRVYFPLHHIGDEATCPYCSAVYVLVDK
jgi:uncharacterized Zn-finger protein